jgi:sodium transport system permease protein
MNNIWITIKKELRGIVRDKKSLMMMLLTPLMIPTFMILFSSIYDTEFSETETEEKTYTVGVNYKLTDTEKEIIKDLKLETEYKESEELLEKAYKKNKLSAYIIKEDNSYKIYSNPSDTSSIEVAALSTSYLDSYNSYLGHEYLSNFPVDFEKVDHSILISTEDLEGSNEFINLILFLGIVFSIMAISLTAIYGVTDSIAGEKERGTLETILTFPIKSKDLIFGKYLAITLSCMITSVISTILTVVSIVISKNNFSLYEGAVLNINFPIILLILLIMISYSFFVSGICIVIASFTKSYKEAQSALTPISLMTMIPMVMNMMEIKMSTKLAFIPLVSHMMLINNILETGITSSVLISFFIIIITSFIYSYILLICISRLYKNEKILFAS